MLSHECGAFAFGPPVRQRGRDPLVEQAAPREAGLLVDALLELLVREVVDRLRPGGLPDQPLADDLLERRDGLLVAAPARLAHRVEVEGAPDGRRRAQHLARHVAERPESRIENVAHLRRQCLLVSGVQGREVLRHEQRQPLALEVDTLLELDRRAAFVRGLHERRDLLLAQPSGPDDGRAPFAGEVRRQPAQPVTGRDALAAPAQNQQQGAAPQPAAEVRDHVQRGGIRGLNVVEKRDTGLGAGAGRADHRADALEQPDLGAGAVEWERGGQVALRQLGQEQRGIGQPLRRDDVPPGAEISGLAQELDDRSVGKTGLVVVTACRQHCCPTAPGRARQLAGQPGLSDPRFALDHGQRAIRPGRRVSVEQRRQLVPAADERQLGWRSCLGGWWRGGRGLRRRRRGEASLVELLVEDRRLLERCHPELLAQHSNAGSVLLERGGAVPGPGIEANERTVRRLVQGIYLEPATGERECLLELPVGDQELHQPAQRGSQLAFQDARFADLPGVELRAVSQREPLEQLAAEQLDRLAELVRSRALRGERAEPPYVDRELGPVTQCDAVGVGVDPLLADCLAQRRERAPEGSAGVLRILAGPEQLTKRGAGAGPFGEDEMGEQGGRLPGVEGDSRATAPNVRRAEQRDLQHGGHRNASWTPPGEALHMSIRRAASWLHLILAVAVALAVFVQVYLIGAYIFGAGPGALDAHRTVGFTAHGLEVLIALVALGAWLPKADVGLSFLLAAIGTVQVALASATRWAGGLHPLGALVVLVLATQLARRGHRRLRGLPRVVRGERIGVGS